MSVLDLTGAVRGVYLGAQTDTLATTPVAALTLTLEGVAGDKHAGWTRRADARVPHYPRGAVIRNERQVSLVAEEELAAIAAQLGLPAIDAAWLGANLLVAGVPAFTLLPPGTRLTFAGGATLRVSGENQPCTGPGKVIQQHHPDQPGVGARFPKAALHRRGVVAVVERPGVIAAGATFTAQLPDQPPYPMD